MNTREPTRGEAWHVSSKFLRAVSSGDAGPTKGEARAMADEIVRLREENDGCAALAREVERLKEKLRVSNRASWSRRREGEEAMRERAAKRIRASLGDEDGVGFELDGLDAWDVVHRLERAVLALPLTEERAAREPLP